MQNFFAKLSKYFYGIEVGQFYEEPIGDYYLYPDWQIDVKFIYHRSVQDYSLLHNHLENETIN